MSDIIDPNAGGGAIVNPVDPVKPDAGGGGTAKDVIINSNTTADRSLQDIATAENQISDYMAAYIMWGARLLGKEKFGRVKPGSLIMRDPNSWTGIYIMWETMFEYFDAPGMFSSMF